MNEMEEVVRIFPQGLRSLLQDARTSCFQAEELRLRVNQPILMEAEGQEWRLAADGSEWERLEKGTAENLGREKRYYRVTAQDIRDTLEYMSRYSLYAFDEELRQGYLTIPGGHRIGLAGQAVVEKGRVKTLRNISFLNIRVAREVKGCADGILPWLYLGKELGSSLIISPPRCGKTTLLRDIIRQVSNGWQVADGWQVAKGRQVAGSGGMGDGVRLSEGWRGTGKREEVGFLDAEGWVKPGEEDRVFPGMTVGVVDERSEIGACYQGVPQHDLGERTDVLDGCPKAEGLMMLIRSMAPRVVAVDEIGSREDMEALQYGMNCGSRILATVHGNSLGDILRKPLLRELAESGVFARYVLLQPKGPPGRIKAILDREGKVIGKGK